MLRLRVLPLAAMMIASVASAQTATTPTSPWSTAGGDADNGNHAATILEMGIAPRAVGLGEAMGAVTGDPASIWYNAAALATLRTNAFLVTGSQRFGDSQLGGTAVTLPTQFATFGIGARALYAGTVEQTENNNIVGRCSAYQMSLEGGGAMELAPKLLLGGSLFYTQETLCQESRGSIGLNAGILSPDLFGRLSLGAGVRNWGTPVTFDRESFRPPLVGFAAAAIDLLKHRNLIQTPMLFRGEPLILDAKAVGEVDAPYHNEIFPKVGLETTLNGVAIARIGYQFGDDNRRGISLGAGVNVGQFRLEYAFRNRKNVGASFWSFDPIGDEHHVSATFFWGGASTNAPVAPVIVTAPIDTAAINDAVRSAVARELENLRPLLDSLRSAQVERTEVTDLVSRYVVPIHFAFDSAVVRDSDYAVLGQIAEVIRQVYPTALVTIEGFADPAGSVEYNLQLSRRRAEAVKQVMIDRFGLPANQFRTVGYGEQQVRQVVPGAEKNAPGALQNRRVTFTIDATRHY